jgi:ureidoacrylate peracid hydrolase
LDASKEGGAMHKISVPQPIIDRVVARRGREHVHDDLRPARTALVVVDMQNAFMLPEVAHSPCLMAQEIVPNINRLAEAVRDTGGTVVWVKTTYTERSRAEWSTYYAMVGPHGDRRALALTANSKGHELWATLKVEPQDLIVEKNRFSAFIQGSSNLAAILRERGLDTVLITGTVTNVCCESTARDAMMLNFKTIMITDGNAAVTDDDHNASLSNFYLTFGDIMSTDFAIGCLRRNVQKGLAAAE